MKNNKKIVSMILVFVLMLSTFTTVLAADRDLVHKETKEKKVFEEYLLDDSFIYELLVEGALEDYYVEVNEKLYNSAEVQEKFDEDPTVTLEEAVVGLDSVEEPTEELEVVKVSAINDVNVEFGTTLAEVEAMLPESITLELSNETTAEVAVTGWTHNYEENVAGEYVFTADYELPEGVTGEKKEATVKVVVAADPEAPVAPVVTGVEDGLVTKEDVTPVVEEVEGVALTVELKKDDVVVEGYELGTAITEEGEYVLTVVATKATNELTAETVVNFVIDKTAPEVKEVEVKDGAKALVVTLDEVVEETEEGSLKATVKKDGIALDFGKAVLSEDGLTVEVPSKNDSVLADGKYVVTVTGLSDVVGNEIADKNFAEVIKKTVASKLEITSVGFAPAEAQVIAYKLTDNYGIEHTDATKLANGEITAATAEVVATGLPLAVEITTKNVAKFNATGLKEDAEVKVTLTYEAGEVKLPAEATLKVGKAPVATSIKDITLSNAQGETDPEENGFVLGKLTKFDLTANLLNQYNSAITPAPDDIVTWSISNNKVVDFTGDDAGKTVLNGAEQKQTFDVKGEGTAVVTAYLANGAKAEYTVTITLAGIKSIAATDVTGAVNFEDKEVTTGFTFTDSNDQTNTIKPLASEVTFEFKEGKDLTAEDITLETLANKDGSFKGLKLNAKKTGTYTITMKYADKTADFTVTSAPNTQVVKLAEIADFTAKAGAAEYKFDVKAMNKHDEKLSVESKKVVLTWYDATGAVDDSAPFTVTYYDVDGKEITTPTSSTTSVAKIGVSFIGTKAATYTLKVEVSGTIAAQTATVTTAVSKLETIKLANGITAADKFALKDTAKKYIDVDLKDTDGDAIVDIENLEVKIVDSNGDDYDTAAFAKLVYKHVDAEGAVTYSDTKAEAAGVALELDAATDSLDAGTYSVFVANGSDADADGYVKSNVVPVVIGEERVLDSVTVEPDSVTVTFGSEAEVVVEAKDQYGDLIKIDPTTNITLAAEATVVKIPESGVKVAKDADDADIDGKYIVTLEGIKAGTEEVTLNVKFSEEVTKEVKVNATVKTAGDVASVEFTNEDLLHRTSVKEEEEKNYNTITLALVGYDADGNKVNVKASDFVWTEDLPAFVEFDANTGELTVKNAEKYPETATGTVAAYQNGVKVGEFTVNFTSEEPKLVELTVGKDDKVIELAPEGTKTLSEIKLAAEYNFEDVEPAEITGDQLTWTSANPAVTVEKAGETGSETLSIKVDENAEVGTEVVLTGVYKNKVVTITVKVIEAVEG